MEKGSAQIKAGAMEFVLKYRYIDGGAASSLNPDQGVSIEVVGQAGGKETELLRFDCFHQDPHYHYGPENRNERIMLDKTTAGNPIGWSTNQLRNSIQDMLIRAGYPEVASSIDTELLNSKLDEVESTAREMAIKQRDTVTHNRGTEVIQAGAIRFGLEYRNISTATVSDRGMAIHVLGDVAGQEIELLAFDCFEEDPHYHYGPRNNNERIYWDKTLVPHPLRWTMNQFKARKLGAMIQRAGYPSIAAELDEELVQAKLPEVEDKAMAMIRANAS